ncbi:ATP-dependent DNA helicase DinG [Alteribacillus bidgolensis]|uniref:3'-5' exonuclease DinG n=1 Tax=Alteribacillus bidgolensis TaxID=930129 RepID=A0A1G8C912_9BACI|nr:ATP-dependent DNA helicase DinG [Alteribacillus bidgolensis]SDH41976.1 ATP-dependent DNA helicase DinG [Alteribacillus bidgolensis]
MSEKYVVIDTETTGNAPKKGDKIIQIGAAVIEDNQVKQTFSTFVRPFQHIPVFIKQLTGISNEDVKNAPSFSEIAPELLELLENAYFIAHNVPFDLNFINQELIQAGYRPFNGPTIDTVECARFLYPTAPGYQLSQLADWLNITHDRPHQADSDAIVTAYLWLNMKEKLFHLPAPTLKSLISLAVYMDSDIGSLIKHAHTLNKHHTLSEEDGIEIYKGLAIKKLEPLQKKEQTSKENILGEKDFFSTDGMLARSWSDYEPRQGQDQIAKAVKKAFQMREHLLIEAGTGIGKSLSYLVPALFYCKEADRRVVVSTHTVNLQEQLMAKEIPLLRKILPFHFNAVVMKGRNHYLCLRKFKQLLNTAPSTYEEVLGLAQILTWILETNTGDVEEINIAGGSSSSFWEKMMSDETTFSEASSSWFPKNYYNRIREQAKHADLLITNHALLFSDLSKDSGFLPSYKNVIVDEAHHLEDLAAKNLGLEVNYLDLTQIFHKLGLMDKTGYFQRLMVYEQSVHQHFSSSWYQYREDHFTLLKYEVDELFRMLYQFCMKTVQTKQTDVGRISIRYIPSIELSSDWQVIQDSLKRVLVLFEGEANEWLSFYQHLSSHAPSGSLEYGLLYDFKAAVKEAEDVCDQLFALLMEKDENYVYWMEIDKKGAANAAYLYARPVDVSDLLADRFFAKKDSVVLTSAALTVENSFTYVMEKWGLVDFAPSVLQLPSPFEYDKKAKVFIPEDMAAIKDGEKEFIIQTAEFIYQAASVTEGKMLVLFTSFDMLKKTYYQLRQWDEASNFVVIGQGLKSGSRLKLLKAFKQYDNAILLGTNAFWEGIDIPGQDLSCLVIVRLPFSPPNEPVAQARMEKIKSAGGNPFREVSLPQAVLRFKQGFGRLIRHQNDKGVVIVLDKRILQSKYGMHFIQSLPKLPVVHKPVDSVLNDIAAFLGD